MLQAIRSTAGSWIVKILFVLLIISFGVWGIGDLTRSTGTSIAEVGDIAISPNQVDQEFRREVDRLRDMLGPEFSADQARQLGVLDQALDRLVQQTLLAIDTRDKGLVPADETVIRTVQEIEGFRNAFGRFDPDIMRAVLRQNGYTEQQFVQLVRNDLGQNLLFGAIAGGTQAPRTMAEALYRFRNEQRVADLVMIPASAMPAPQAPDEATLAQFHKDHAVRYTAPEYRTITVASIGADDLAEEIAVSDEDLQQAYDARRSEFVTPETRDLVQVVAPTREDADKIVAAVRAGTPLVQAAEAAGQSTVDLPGVTKADMLEGLADPAFALELGAVSDPLESPLGWHVITATAITPGGERSLAEVRDQLLADTRRERALDRLFEVANSMDDALAGGATLAEAAEKAGASVTTLEQVDSAGASAAGAPPPSLPGLPRILSTAFGLQEGETSNMTETDQQTYFAVHVDSVTQAQLRPLETVRAQVLADWTAEQQSAAAKAKAEEVATQLREGGDPQAIAAGIPGATTLRTDPMLRTPATAVPLPPAAIQELFTLAPGGVTLAATNGDQVVARLVEVIPADPANDGGMIAQIQTTASDTLANDLVGAYVQGLRDRHTVDINRTNLNNMYSRAE